MIPHEPEDLASNGWICPNVALLGEPTFQCSRLGTLRVQNRNRGLRCRTRAHFNEMIAAPGAVASTTIRVPAGRRTGSRNRYVRVHSSR